MTIEFWTERLKQRTPERDADHEGLAELNELTSRAFSPPYLTHEESKRQNHLASHLRQVITLNPGPRGSGDEDYAHLEGLAREILAAIALNPDGSHWSYIASMIKDSCASKGKEVKNG